MDLTVHIYGYGHMVFHNLTAIAMLRNSNLYPSMVNVIGLMVGTYYAMRMAAANAEGEWRQYLMKVFGMITLINALLLPTTSMNIRDHIAKGYYRVDNLPLAFALPIGALENMGNLITQSFEQAFAAIGGEGAFSYYHYGTAYGARLAKQLQNVKIRNPEYVSNMRNFIDRCVILPAMIGRQFTKEELVGTTDMWGLVSSRAGVITRTDMVIDGVRQVPSPTCREAVPYFERKMSRKATDTIAFLSDKMKTRLKGTEYNPSFASGNGQMMMQIEALYKNKYKVETILKHNMMMNSLNSARAASYPAVKAKLQQEASGLLTREMSDHIMTGFHVVMKNIIYASFIFMVPMMLLSGGMRSYRGWITVCLSLQLWPAIMAVLNMMVDMGFSKQYIINYSSWSTARKQYDTISSIAASLTLMVPFLAIYMTRMAEGGLIHMAGGLLRGSQGGVDAASRDEAGGIKSHDGENIGNVTRSNTNSNKLNENMEYSRGEQIRLDIDGNNIKTMESGKQIHMGGAGHSSGTGETTITEGHSMNYGFRETINQDEQLLEGQTASLNETKEQQTSLEASAMTSLLQAQKNGKNLNIDTSTEEGKEVMHALNEIDRRSKGDSTRWQTNAEAYIKGNKDIGGSVGRFLLKNLGGAKAEVGAGYTVARLGDHTAGRENSENAETHNTERLSQAKRMNDIQSIMQENGFDKTRQEQVREGYSNIKRMEDSISATKNKIDTYSKAQEFSNNNTTEFRKDIRQEVVDAYREKYNCSDIKAARAIDSREGEAFYREYSMQKAKSYVDNIQKKGENIQNSNTADQLIRQNEHKIETNPGRMGGAVDSFAQRNDIASKEEIQNRMSENRQEIDESS